MTHIYTHFWDEVMSEDEKSSCVSRLFAWLDASLVGQNNTGCRTYIFVPVLPNFKQNPEINDFDVCRFNWGYKGRGEAVATDSIEIAKCITPYMFDLGTGELHVISFESQIKEKEVLNYWVSRVLIENVESLFDEVTKRQDVPNYAMLSFESGDLVGDPPLA